MRLAWLDQRVERAYRLGLATTTATTGHAAEGRAVVETIDFMTAELVQFGES